MKASSILCIHLTQNLTSPPSGALVIYEVSCSTLNAADGLFDVINSFCVEAANPDVGARRGVIVGQRVLRGVMDDAQFITSTS